MHDLGPAPLAHFLREVEAGANVRIALQEYTALPGDLIRAAVDCFRELRNQETAVKLRQMGTKPGWPDFVLIPPAGQLHCLELKRAGETLSEDREAFQLWCIKHGVPHSTTRTLDEALAALAAWGCLRLRIAVSKP